MLFNKLEKCGIRGLVLDWIKSYLKEQQQFVKLGNHCSKYLDITCGVPLGSVLGPKFFMFYINDICRVSTVLKLVSSEDDTNIFGSGDNSKQLESVKNKEKKKLKIWVAGLNNH